MAQGFPAKKTGSSRGESWSIDTTEAIRWLVAQALAEAGSDGLEAPLDVKQSRARLFAAQAGLAELDLRRRRGETLDAARLAAALAVMDGVLRDRMMMVPTTAAPEIIGMVRQGAPAVAEVIRRHLEKAFLEFSSAELVAAAARPS